MSAMLAARAEQTADAIDAFNQRYETSSAKFARLPEVLELCTPGASSDAATHRALAALNAQPAEDPQVEAAAILSPTGSVIVATAGELVGRDLSSRSFVRRVLRGEPAISDIYVETTGEREWPTVAYAQPVRGQAGEIIGALVLWARAGAIWDITKASNALAGSGSFAVMFNAEGVRIAHSYQDAFVFLPGGELPRAELDALVAEGRFGRRTRQLLADVRSFPQQFERSRAGRPDTSLFVGFAPVNGKMSYGVARRLKSQPWTLFYMLPKQTLDERIVSMTRQRLAFGGLIMLGVIAAALLFSRIIVQPVLSLSEATERLARGELSARVSVGGRTDELGQLANDFNAMAAQIESQSAALSKGREELEHRVQQRTRELTETARLLEAEVIERRRAEQELKRSQARFAALSDAGVIGLMTITLQGRTIDANDAALEIIGYSREEVMSPDFNWTALTPSDWRSHDDLARAQLGAEGVVRPREKEYLHKDGHRIPVLTGALQLAGSTNEVLAFVLDLSERRRAEAALTRLKHTEASEAKFRGLLEAAPDAIVIIDPSGNIAIVNAQAEKMFGYMRDELLDKPVEMLMPPRFAAQHELHRKRYFAEPKARAMGAGLELLGIRRDGSEFPIEISLSPLKVQEGLLVSAAIRDIGDRKRAADALARAKEEAEAANRELEAFSYSVAHDLRAPLRGMNGFAQVLLNSYGEKLDDDGRDWLNEIVLNAAKMGTLIDALLSLARLSRAELRRERVELSAFAREVARDLALAEPERKVDWAIEQGVEAHADPVLARALIQNLVGNAWKFSGKRGAGARIELGTCEHGGERAYFVRDNGAGFDPAFANKLFAPFQRLHTIDEFPGTGIGLATVQRIVHRHGGRIWAEGAVDRGATFYFTLSSRLGTV